MKQIINQLSSNPKRLFLIDGIGALISAFFLGIVLVQLEPYIGMPVHMLHVLGAIALIFACYSITCYFINPKNWKAYLRLITIANAIYCVLTIGLVVYLFQSLTVLGLTYFVVEIIIVLILIRFEALTINRNK